MQISINSFRLTQEQLLELAIPNRFQQIIQKADRVDSLKGHTTATLEMFLDFMASELGIAFSENHQVHLIPQDCARVISTMSRSYSQQLRQTLNSLPNWFYQNGRFIDLFAAYIQQVPEGGRLTEDTIAFFRRQAELCRFDDRYVLVVADLSDQRRSETLGI